MAHFCTGFSDSDGDGLGMDIQPAMDYRIAHGVSELWFYDCRRCASQRASLCGSVPHRTTRGFSVPQEHLTFSSRLGVPGGTAAIKSRPTPQCLMHLNYSTSYHCSCDLRLASERTITLKSFEQQMTYAGLLEGVPSRALNDRLIQSVIDEVGSRPQSGGHRPFVIPPVRRDYCRVPGDMGPSPIRSGVPEWLPSIRCIGSFESFPPARDTDMHASALDIVWFQDDYAMPIAETILDVIRNLDWTSTAYDFEY